MSRITKVQSHLERLAALPQNLERGIELADLEDDTERRTLDYDGIGARVQSAYTGLETLLEATLVLLGVAIPKGESSHKAILDTAEAHLLIGAEERPELDAIKGFRHVHRHVYDIVLDEDLLRERALSLARLLPPILDRIRARVAGFQETSGPQ